MGGYILTIIFIEEKDIPEHMMIEGFRWSIGPWPAKIS